jgi:hypothetical protein
MPPVPRYRRSRFSIVRADYGDETSLVPTTMSLTLENRETGASVSFTFENDDGGGLGGTAKRNQAVEFVAAQGCEHALAGAVLSLLPSRARVRGGATEKSFAERREFNQFSNLLHLSLCEVVRTIRLVLPARQCGSCSLLTWEAVRAATA